MTAPAKMETKDDCVAASLAPFPEVKEPSVCPLLCPLLPDLLATVLADLALVTSPRVSGRVELLRGPEVAPVGTWETEAAVVLDPAPWDRGDEVDGPRFDFVADENIVVEGFGNTVGLPVTRGSVLAVMGVAVFAGLGLRSVDFTLVVGSFEVGCVVDL